MTEQAEEWGPWIKHDGMGCPCVGLIVQAFHTEPVPPDIEGAQPDGSRIFRAKGLFAWSGGGFGDVRGELRYFPPIILYRIRKPRALAQLRELVESLPELEDA